MVVSFREVLGGITRRIHAVTVSLSGDMPSNDQVNPRYTTMGDSTA